jgi:hypothetical protein
MSRRDIGDYKLWRSAVEFVNKEKSSIRSEVRLIDGVEVYNPF